MNRQISVLAASLVLALAAGSAFARGPGGGAGGMGGMGGGQSSQHFSEQGMANTNGPNAADRDKGLERARDRMHEEGLENSKADRGMTKRQGKGKSGKAER